MAALVPWYVWPIVFGVDLALIAFVVLALRRHVGRGAAAAGMVFSAWFVLVTLLSAAQAFASGPARPPRIGFGVFLPVVAGVLALASSRTLRARVLAIPQHWLVGIQSLRVIGVVFLVLLAQGTLPRQFALPAGWGDIAVGAAAPLVAYALATGKRWAPPLAVAWNVVGLLDLGVAVGIGALSAESSIRLFPNAPTTDAMAALPLSLIPTFGVPIFALLHVVSLLGLRARAEHRARRPQAGAHALAR